MFHKHKVYILLTKDRNEIDVNVQQLKEIDVVECSIEGNFKSPIMQGFFEKKTNDKNDSTSNVYNLVQFEQNINRNNNNHLSSSESTSPKHKKQ